MVSRIIKYSTLILILFVFIGGRQEFFDLFDTDTQVELLDIESGEDESEKEEYDQKTFFLWFNSASETRLSKTISSLYSHKSKHYSGDFHREILFPPEY